MNPTTPNLGDSIPARDLREQNTLYKASGTVKGSTQQEAPGVFGGFEEDRIPGMVKEYTAWDVYNNEARKVDTELVKDWRESLNSILVFTAIFAAVLAAFIIESKKMLEPDWTAVLADATIFSIQNAGNLSNIQYSPPRFEPTSAAVSINSLLFASLGASLVAALASVVALQWVADFDAAITRGGSFPEEQATRRQLRFAGVVWWRMSEIIATLPLLLYCSVALFAVGAIQWMWTLNHVVGYVAIGGTTIGAAFYISTTLLGAIWTCSPFQTPHSRVIYWLYRQIARLFPSLPLLLSGLAVVALYALLPLLSPFLLLRLLLELLPPPFSCLHNRPTYLCATWDKAFRAWDKALYGAIGLMKAAWTKKYKGSPAWKDQATEQDSRIKAEALIWLDNRLPTSIHSHNRRILLLREIVAHLSREGLSLSLDHPTWLDILSTLAWHIMRKVLNGTLLEDEYDAVHTLMQCSAVPQVKRRILPSEHYPRPHVAAYLGHSCFASHNLVMDQVIRPEHMLFLFSRDVPIPSRSSKHEIEATIKLIKWRNQAGNKTIDIWMKLFADKDLYSSEYLRSCLRTFARLVRPLSKVTPYETFTQLFHPLPDNEVYDPVHESSWLAALIGPEKDRQVVQALEAIDTLFDLEPYRDFHRDVIWLISKSIETNKRNWSSRTSFSEDLCQRLASIDPCLAVIGAHMCGVYVSVTERITKTRITADYAERHHGSLAAVQDLFYQHLSLSDPVALWQIRASIWSDSTILCSNMVRQALVHPEELSILQLIFKHPTPCCGHRPGPHHILFHMYRSSPPTIRFHEKKLIYGKIDLQGMQINLILGLLACCEDSSLIPDTYHEYLQEGWLERLRTICKRVKSDRNLIFPLLRDIISHQLRLYYPDGSKSATLILECVEQAMVLPIKETPLNATAITCLVDLPRDIRMLSARLAHRTFTIHADKICCALEAHFPSKIHPSVSWPSSVSCARVGTSLQTAVVPLSMYISL